MYEFLVEKTGLPLGKIYNNAHFIYYYLIRSNKIFMSYFYDYASWIDKLHDQNTLH